MDLYDLWFVFVEKMESHAEELTGSAKIEAWLPTLPKADGDFLVLAGFVAKYSNCGSFTDSARSWREHHERLASALVSFGYAQEASRLDEAADLEDQLRNEEEAGEEVEAASEVIENACSISPEDIMEKVLDEPARFAIDARDLIQEPFMGRTGPL